MAFAWFLLSQEMSYSLFLPRFNPCIVGNDVKIDVPKIEYHVIVVISLKN